MQPAKMIEAMKSQRKKFVDYINQTYERIRSDTYKQRSKQKAEDFTRNRKMPFVPLICFMLKSMKQSTQTALEDHFFEEGDIEHMRQQSFSEARHKVKVSAFSELFEMTVQIAYEGYYDTWHGYRLSAIDGSDIALPADEELRQYYGTVGRNNTSVSARGSIFYDLLNKVVMDADIAPMSYDERSMAAAHIYGLEKIGQKRRELTLFDRGYASFDLIRVCKEQNVRFLMRVKRGFNKEIDNMPEGMGKVTLEGDDGETIDVRVIKFMLPSNEMEMLITDIWDKHLGVEDFKALYFMRWGVETKYDEVKNKLEIENFTGRTRTAIEQDFYATMYLSNVASAACWEAQEIASRQRTDSDNKYDYHVNINHAVGTLKRRFIMAMVEEDPDRQEDLIAKILFLLAKSVCQVRPNRTVAREPVRKAKFHHNRKSNC